jgi:hypothetical protein
VRITGQLIDASNGTHGGIEDIFDLQDQVTASVVGAIAPKLEQAEIARARRKRSDSLDAYDLYLRALPHVHANSLDEMKLALPLLEKALAIDPDYAIAHAYAAWCREQMFTHGGSRSTATPPLHTASAPWFVLCMTTTTPGSSRRSVRCDWARLIRCAECRKWLWRSHIS